MEKRGSSCNGVTRPLSKGSSALSVACVPCRGAYHVFPFSLPPVRREVIVLGEEDTASMHGGLILFILSFISFNVDCWFTGVGGKTGLGAGMAKGAQRFATLV